MSSELSEEVPLSSRIYNDPAESFFNRSPVVSVETVVNAARLIPVAPSLSKSINQKIKDAFKVYFYYQKMNFIKAVYFTILLSINYILKNYKWFIYK